MFCRIAIPLDPTKNTKLKTRRQTTNFTDDGVESPA